MAGANPAKKNNLVLRKSGGLRNVDLYSVLVVVSSSEISVNRKVGISPLCFGGGGISLQHERTTVFNFAGWRHRRSEISGFLS